MWISHADTVSGLALSPDRLLLYSISWDRTIKVWRTSDFKCLKSIEGAHDDAINAIVVSKDGTVYTGSADAKIKVWKKNALVMTLQKHREMSLWPQEWHGEDLTGVGGKTPRWLVIGVLTAGINGRGTE
ncbi:hypothetical protein QJS04_geneDACA015185 [Acorus gramineus]|uniref:Uncharacterized protein n=1 Tax=Acorus gramineus TaxID=55184 RepID=A0AAV9B6V2_ACOGR|nr:hypothetical protein QJS04_geneDACA015185 [Acorus gramineus]